MFKVICEKVGLTKSNIRTIGRILNAIKYPPIDDDVEQEAWFFALSIIGMICVCVMVMLFTASKITWQIFFVAGISFWAIRWTLYGIRHLIPFAIRTVWNGIPEGRKKKLETVEEPEESAIDEEANLHLTTRK